MLVYLKPFLKPQFFVVVLAILVGYHYQKIFDQYKKIVGQNLPYSESQSVSSQQEKEKIFTKEELAKYNGENGAPLYLALLGLVFDVSKGFKHYGPGCSYNFFVGRDASVSFVTGEFEDFIEDEADDVNKLKPNDLVSLNNWQKFYMKEYAYVGKVMGRFYDSSGLPTSYHIRYSTLLNEAQTLNVQAELLRSLYPDCNVEWSPEKDTRVWCTTSSGGKQRDWIGYPRKLYEIGSNIFRCACVHQDNLNTRAVMLQPYKNCEANSHECYYAVD